ncbi:MAG TPA: outer membrane beta-barrel protein, partial [Chitinophagaceae bacterium]|nr:outer membrane beta-barrel protein [Chitinophagaceae bacterium]
QYSFTPSDHFKAYLNYAGGKNVDTTKTDQFDLVLTSKISDRFNLGYNGTINRTATYLGNKIFDETKNWWGSALYVHFDPSAKAGFTLRQEVFNDDNQLKIYGSRLKGGNIMATTVSANFKSSNLVFIPEFRWEKASEAIFLNSEGESRTWASRILLAVICQF